MKHIRIGRPRVWSTLLIAILAVVAVVTAGLAMWGKPVPPGTGPQVAASTDSSGMPGPSDGPAALFVGDSYTMGPFGLADLGYACLTAANMGWQCNMSNQPGTGYIAGGEGQRLPRILGALDTNSTSINERFAHLRELYEADVVVLDGGRNDLRFGVFYLQNMLEYTIHRAVEAWPKARIVVIAPWLISDVNVIIPGTDVSVNSYLETELRKKPEFDAVTYIDPAALGWFKDLDMKQYMDADGVHPNFAGHRKVAEYLTAALRQNNFADVQ
jgi:lysophospholipase L1-like esterase